jgi:hypothetical protein
MKQDYHTPGLDIEKIVDNATKAARAFRNYSQEQTDKIAEAVFRAGFNNRINCQDCRCDR